MTKLYCFASINKYSQIITSSTITFVLMSHAINIYVTDDMDLVWCSEILVGRNTLKLLTKILIEHIL